MKTHIDTIEELAAQRDQYLAQRDVLLEALKEIADYPENHNMTNGGDAGHRAMAYMARLAIALPDCSV